MSASSRIAWRARVHALLSDSALLHAPKPACVLWHRRRRRQQRERPLSCQRKGQGAARCVAQHSSAPAAHMAFRVVRAPAGPGGEAVAVSRRQGRRNSRARQCNRQLGQWLRRRCCSGVETTCMHERWRPCSAAVIAGVCMLLACGVTCVRCCSTSPCRQHPCAAAYTPDRMSSSCLSLAAAVAPPAAACRCTGHNDACNGCCCAAATSCCVPTSSAWWCCAQPLLPWIVTLNCNCCPGAMLLAVG